MSWLRVVEYSPPPSDNWLEVVTTTAYPVVSIVSGHYGVAGTWAHRTQCSQCKRSAVSPKATQAQAVFEAWCKKPECEEKNCPVTRDRKIRRRKRA